MRNYLLVLLRNLRREKLYTAINIAGLALGIACCLILGLFLKSELTFDQYNLNHRNIYRLVNEFTNGGTTSAYAVSSRVIGPMLHEDYPGVVRDFVRFQANSGDGGLAMRHGNQVYYWPRTYFVSPNVFEVFTHKILYGDPRTALNEGGNVAISEAVAHKYFGNENPIGEILTSDSGRANKITLVFADQPANTHLKYDMLFSDKLPFLTEVDSATRRLYMLFNLGNITYLVMDPTFKPSDWKRINDDFFNKHMLDQSRSLGTQWRSWLQPLSATHLQTEVTDPQSPTGNRMYLYACVAVALVILLIACINYINLATARATRRARSVGIRKILGASRLRLALQFLGESILFTVIALVLGVVMVEVALTLTPINSLMDGQVSLNLLQEHGLAGWLLGLAAGIGLLAGAYPALYLSSWAPLTALAGKHLAGKGNLRMRELLVLVQFTISATAITCTLLMIAQMHYIANKPLGFEKHNRLVVTMRGVPTIDKAPSIRNELLRDSHIHGVAFGEWILGQPGTPMSLASVENEDGSTGTQAIYAFSIGEGFEKVMGLQVQQGRELTSRALTDVGTNLLVNEAMVRKMRWTSPLGKKIHMGSMNGGVDGRVVGVVRDFNFQSLHSPIEPMAMFPLKMAFSGGDEVSKAFVRDTLLLDISPQDIGSTLAYVGKVMANADPKHPFEYFFLDASLDSLYKAETQLTRLIGILAAISIFIACLGLFGLAAFTTEQRTREIGTRKVLGATTWQIVAMLSRRILVLVLIAAVLAAVLSYFVIAEWVEGFAYRAGLNPLVFVVAAAGAALVAFATVALQSHKTASADPVNSLRHT